MDLEMVLNELSLRPLATDVYAARARMKVLGETMVGATCHGVKKILRTKSNFVTEELAPNYPVAKWLNDVNVDRELRLFLKGMATKSPFLVDIANENVLESYGLSDYFFGENQAVGLGIVFLLDALAVSLRSNSCWFENHLRLNVSQMDDEENLTDVFEDIPNASIIDHINMHLPWITTRLQMNAQSDVHDGSDIWLHKDEWFPHLYFCDHVREQLETLQRGHLMLMPILKRLYELEHYCSNWLDGSFDHRKIVSKVTPESAATLDRYSLERTFLCHDGVSRVFSWHLRLTPGAWRLYFFPLPEVHILIIGYVGSHLSTMLHAHSSILHE